MVDLRFLIQRALGTNHGGGAQRPGATLAQINPPTLVIERPALTGPKLPLSDDKSEYNATAVMSKTVEEASALTGAIQTRDWSKKHYITQGELLE